MMITVTNYPELSLYALWLLILTWLVRRFLLQRGATAKPRLPPGPTPVPIFGNFFQLGPIPYKGLAKLASVHGPLMTMRLGATTAVVASTASAARDIFLDNDLPLSTRGVYHASTALGHSDYSILWLPNGARWRHIRKILNFHVFSGFSLDLSRHLREQKVADLLAFVERQSGQGAVVDVGEAMFNLTLNFMSNTVFSMDLADPNSSTSSDFKKLVREISDTMGRPNLADFFPFLGVFDLQGIRRTVARHFKKIIDLFDGLIEDRLAGKSSVAPKSEQDILGILLKFCRDEKSETNRTFINHVLVDLFMAGTDTTSSTTEYAMAELIKNPDKMKRLREELDSVIGRGNQIRESDVANLPYLEAVVKETLRLHPPIPLANRKNPDADIEAGGFTIPKGSKVWVNLWAVGRDPNVWPEPLKFEPERHVGSESDFRSKKFELIPFGMGRRICAGLPLVMRMNPLVLGSLVHSFDWKLEGDAKAESLDMDEMFGLTLQKAVPLRAIPVKV